MFDSSPSNLPVEPPATPPSSPQPVPRKPAVQTPTPLTTVSGSKEPEDIFSGMADASGSAPAASSMPEIEGLEDRPARPIGKILAIVLLLVLVFGGAGAGVYYFLVIRPTAQEEAKAIAEANQQRANTTPSPVPSTSVTSPTTEAPVPTAPTTEQPSPEAPVPSTPTTSDQNPNIPPPVPVNQPTTTPEPLLAALTDTDGDGLTDVEELVLGVDARLADSDGDGFQDAAEIKGLYSPAEKSASITAMSTIKAVKWSSVGFLMPTAWNLVDQTDTTAVIQTSNGERFTLSLYPASAASSIQGESFKTKNGNDAVAGFDGVTGEVVVGAVRFVIAPEDTARVSAAYRTIVYLILQSARSAR